MAPPGDIDRSAAGATDPSQADEILVAAAAGQHPANLVDRIVELPPAEALATTVALSRSRQPDAALILVALAESNAPKPLRKEARRGLHHLRALGLDVPRPSPPPAPSPTAERQAELVEAWATISDGIGSRAVSLMAEHSRGGVVGLSMVLNDVVGIKASIIEETTRRRYRQSLAEWQSRTSIPWAEIPVDYARQLIGEAIALNRESGFTIPQEYQLHQDDVRDLARPFERAIIYDEIPATEVTLNPELLETSPELLEEEDFRGWFFGFDEVRGFALDLLQARQSQIVLSEQLQAEREERIIANAIREVVTPPIKRALGRRLEEAAFVLLRTGRQHQARQAVAAAHRLNEGALMLHPLLVAMMERSLEVASEAETAGIPLELVRRSPYDPVD